MISKRISKRTEREARSRELRDNNPLRACEGHRGPIWQPRWLLLGVASLPRPIQIELN